MEIEVAKEFWANAVSIDVLTADMAFQLEGVTGVSIANRSDSFVSLRVHRTDGILGSFTFPVAKAVSLMADLKVLGALDITAASAVLEVAS